MNLNFFKKTSPLFEFRWFIITFIAVAGLMLYSDISGIRMFTFSNQQQWSSSGPGSHK